MRQGHNHESFQLTASSHQRHPSKIAVRGSSTASFVLSRSMHIAASENWLRAKVTLAMHGGGNPASHTLITSMVTATNHQKRLAMQTDYMNDKSLNGMEVSDHVVWTILCDLRGRYIQVDFPTWKQSCSHVLQSDTCSTSLVSLARRSCGHP